MSWICDICVWLKAGPCRGCIGGPLLPLRLSLEPAIIVGLGKKWGIDSVGSGASLDTSRLRVCCQTSSLKWATAGHSWALNSTHSIGSEWPRWELLCPRAETGGERAGGADLATASCVG